MESYDGSTRSNSGEFIPANIGDEIRRFLENRRNTLDEEIDRSTRERREIERLLGQLTAHSRATEDPIRTESPAQFDESEVYDLSKNPFSIIIRYPRDPPGNVRILNHELRKKLNKEYDTAQNAAVEGINKLIDKATEGQETSVAVKALVRRLFIKWVGTFGVSNDDKRRMERTIKFYGMAGIANNGITIADPDLFLEQVSSGQFYRVGDKSAKLIRSIIEYCMNPPLSGEDSGTV